MLKKSALALAAAALLLSGCEDGTDPVFVIYATDGDSIYTINGSNTVDAERRTLVGLNAGTQLYALDVNPKGGALNGLGSDGQSYLIENLTGIARPMGTPSSTPVLTDRAVEMDYNPTVPAQTVYRVVTSTGDNYRRNDTTGATAGTDSQFVYKTGDVNAGKPVVISGIAYTNSQRNETAAAPAGSTYTGPAATTLYGIDSQNDTLVIIGSNDPNGADRSAPCPNATNPNCGQLTTVGQGLGLDVSGYVGFDILNVDTAYAMTYSGATYNLYTVDLNSGRMDFVSVFNPKIFPLRAFAVQQ